MHFLATHADATVMLQHILCFQATATDTMLHSIRTPPRKEQTSSFVHSDFGIVNIKEGYMNLPTPTVESEVHNWLATQARNKNYDL